VDRIYLSPPHMGPHERELLLAAFDSNWIAPLGPHVDGFERELAGIGGVQHAAALSSGTAALHLALILLGVGPGDPVVTSTLTFAATANAIRYVGAEPVFVDVDPASWTMDPALVGEALADLEARGTPAKAVVTVDLYGQVTDHAAIDELCRPRGIPVVEDAAEALGSTRGGRPAGSFGAMAALSFNGNKIITTSGGGALLSDRRDLIERARFLATQARDPAPHYQHSTVGYNYRLSNLLAAVGRGQLRALPERVAARRANREAYVAALGDLPGVRFLHDPPEVVSNAWLTVLTIDAERLGADREAIRLALEAEDIESRPVWKPMHLQPVFEACRAYGGDVAARLFRDGLCLPSGSSLGGEDRARVVARFREAAGARRAGATG
jgi:dTDP-4-amino-4,6-dideoxygalactose transaminase